MEKFLSHTFIDSLMKMPQQARDQYRAGIDLIMQGRSAEVAFQESGFTDSYLKETEDE